MPRLFVGNFDFEHQLASPGHTASRRLQRINAELATCWLAIAEDGDRIWTPEAIAEDFWQTATACGLPNVRGTVDAVPPAGFTLAPWGWTRELEQHRSHEVPGASAIRLANSRLFSAELERDWGVGLAHSAIARDLAAVTGAIERIVSDSSRWVIKANFGMSGRERLLGSGRLSDRDYSWVARRLAADGVVFVEPWVEAVAEAGLQFDIGADGQIEFLGVAEMLPSTRGQYAGTIFADSSSHGERNWSLAIDVAARAVGQLRQLRYQGPVGIDAMLYRRADGSVGCRPLQDINARWTMGRLALGWRRRFPEVRFGYWWHGTALDFAVGRHLEAVQTRRPGSLPSNVIRTSPPMIGDQPAQHVSALICGQGDSLSSATRN